jgi:formylglycine-generating enzyme required for sulfatase activity
MFLCGDGCLWQGVISKFTFDLLTIEYLSGIIVCSLAEQLIVTEMKKMNLSCCLSAVALAGLSVSLTAGIPAGFVYESKLELVTSGDFDGNGLQDIAVVERSGGKFRIGFQMKPGEFMWAPVRLSGAPNVAGISAGKLLNAKKDSLAIVSAEGSSVFIIDGGTVESSGPITPVSISCMGPSALTAIGVGGAGQSSMSDLVVGSIFNVDPQNLATLFRNAGGKLTQTAEVGAPGALTRANRLTLKEGTAEMLGFLLPDKGGDTFVVQSLESGKPVTVAQVTGLPSDVDYAVGNFRKQPLLDFVFFKKGTKQLLFRPVEEAGGKLSVGAGTAFDMEKIISQVVSLGDKLIIQHNTNEPAGLYSFDGTKAPTLIQPITPPLAQMACGAIPTEKGFVVLYMPIRTRLKYSAEYQVYAPLEDGKYKGSRTRELPTLDIGDLMVVPDIAKNIAATSKEVPEADMNTYTNTIPGTQVTYVMVPIRGGEFTMGSPDSESDRNADEGPQHKVKVGPFWMGRCEVTWNEYELFMYPDDEKKLRQNYPSDPNVDKISDGCTRPSKPYVEMSFGMGKDGFPAIAMSQHGANKYCQWLSAKTGQFFRLPTEAEWEYACRAGTATAYSFGNDAAQLPEYAWFANNADMKYQKVATKKPNPWGLFDMHGNVTEWCIDQYEENYDKVIKGDLTVEPWNKATQPYPHVARGGSWNDDAPKLRSSARVSSTPDWKAQDPQLPKSYWYLTDAQFIGFRLVRPLKVPTTQEMEKYWISGVEKD